jgi:amino acid transporter
MLACAAVNYTLSFIMVVSKHMSAGFNRFLPRKLTQKPRSPHGHQRRRRGATHHDAICTALCADCKAGFTPRERSSMLTYCDLQFYNVTQSKSASTALTALFFLLMIFGLINQVTTTSRQLWSFARDGGLPWSHWLSRVHRSKCINYA